MIRVTYTVDLPEWWGADECYADGGNVAVIELIHEDISAFLEGGDWCVEKVDASTAEVPLTEGKVKLHGRRPLPSDFVRPPAPAPWRTPK